jgi:methyl-accepting chemotaxis protein
MALFKKRSAAVIEHNDKAEGARSNEALNDIRMKSALEACKTNVMIADENYHIVYMNKTMMEMMKEAEGDLRKDIPALDANRLIGASIDTFHKNPSHQRRVLDSLRSQIETDIKIGGRSFHLVVTPVTDDDGKRVGTVVEWKDETEQKTAERANFRVRSGLDVCTTNVMVADEGFNIVYLNNTLKDMLRAAEPELRKVLPNFDANKLIGQNMDTFHRDPSHQRRMVGALTGTHRTNITVGTQKFGLIATAIVDGNNNRVGTVVEWRNETAEKAIEAEINEVVAAAVAGNFSRRIPTENKQGFMLNLATSMNLLSENVGKVMDDLSGVLGALSEGDLSKRIAAEYQGTFGAMKDAANTTAIRLSDTVEDLARTLGALADGDLTQRITADYRGTFMTLKEAANTTATRLSETMAGIMSSAREVANASSEISTSTTDLSQRTEEQAASLEQTSASMTQIATTVKKNAENAQQANQLTSGARETADRGGQVVARAVEAMSRIEESSRKIADIIGVIDEIARQTNLLALNAAVEAARAGDAGRGFAVVASEVRSLAQRSSQAAKDIKDLITNSNSQVREGVGLVNDAGKSLGEIVEAIKNVANIVGDIANASTEQATGVEQVNKALTQMDEVTQQNSALVEQNAATAKTLEEQSSAMDERVSFFRIDDAETSLRAGRAAGKPAAAPRTPAAPAGKPKHSASPRTNGATRHAPVRRMQAALATAVAKDSDWEEF